MIRAPTKGAWIMGHMVHTNVRVDVEHVPGAIALIGFPGRGGLVDLAGCDDRAVAVVELLRQALAMPARSREAA